ncbi:MAG: SDR family oxidoreductase [Caldilinea sp. CFX5]|nr:SDR family oxidoreductase [Caldilinea sp. CFX5]
MATSFDQQVIVITGAGRGLGFGMAQRFGAAGARVILAEVDATLGRQAEAELQRAGLAAHFAPLDVRDPSQSRALVHEVVKRYGRLDVWVNNAGLSTIAPAETLDPAEWDALVAVNLSGVFYCAQAAGQQMLAQGKGVILNIASITGLLHIEGRAAYSVSKAGVVALTEALGIEWAQRGVRVVAIAPGVVATPMAQAVFDQGIAARTTYERRTPMHRLGTVDEIAEAALFLASDEAAYITAETLRVDGGWTAYQLF